MAKNTFDTKGNKLVFEFASPEAANHFKHWLCGQGEQDYWIWMEYREQEEKGDITAVAFDYFNGENIPAKCGRLDK
jgi:hypothetical protein